MNVKEIRKLYSVAPFEPFELVLTNGARLLIDHPSPFRAIIEQCTCMSWMAAPSGST